MGPERLTLHEITKVDPNLDRKDQTYQPRNADDKYNYELCTSNQVYLNLVIADWAQTDLTSTLMRLFAYNW